VARALELQRAGIAPPRGSEQLWTTQLRRPTVLVGLTIDREELGRRIEARVEEMVAAGAAEEAHRADASGTSRTARAALGFEALLEGDLEAVKRAHRAYARRQLTWMRKMSGVELIDRTGRDDASVAEQIVAGLGDEAHGEVEQAIE
jgi:tRNA dimethylallyltransferase